ncbi:MAG: DUF366 family protein [Armatimonadota bacterium]
MQTHQSPGSIAYTGHQLRSHWILETFGLQGDAIVAFRGPCRVELAEMVDVADVVARQPIQAAEMLHLIAEHFDRDLHRAVLRQHLLICVIAEALAPRPGVPALRRDGDDLFAGERKLSVSIATVSPVSALIHVGLNIDPAGAPVPAVGLAQWGVDADELGAQVLDAYAREIADVQLAACKVRGVP